MLNYVLTILGSFTLTFVICFPFIKLLYRYNIRRISKADLDAVLPGRQVKMGTPIMGGAVIMFSLIFFSILLLAKWEYFWMIVLVGFFGGIFGGIDEYINTLGRTVRAVRISKSDKGPISFFPVKGVFLKIKNILLIPWRLFEEAIRVMGSEQRGMKAHYKIFTHLGLAMIACVFLAINGNGTYLELPIFGAVNLGAFYYVLLVIYLIAFANAFGITDGMDGLSAGTHSIVFAFYGILAAYLGFTEVALLAFIVVGAELAFLYFNIYPARMEMSDVGTLPLGIIFALLPILIHKELSVLFIGSIFIIEILSSVGQQWSVKLRGKRIFLVAPIHHHFEKMGWEETKVVERFWLFTAISGLVGLAVALVV